MIVITAPTGLIGHQVLDHVLDGDEPIRVIARDPSRLSPKAYERVEVVQGSHGDRDVVQHAFDGADTLFWLLPPDPQAASVYGAFVGFSIPAADAIVRHGVERVVSISALGREVQRYAGFVSASLAMDDMLASTGANTRSLTMPSFMDNLVRQAGAIKSRGAFFSPISGDLKPPSVATSDIASVAADLLLDHSCTGQGNVPVLGLEDLSFDDMARVMSDVLGMPVRFQQIPGEDYKATMMKNGMSDAMAQGMLDMVIAKDHGIDKASKRTPESTTPTSFRQWCKDALRPWVLS